MIYGIGTDIIEIERVAKACGKDSFLRKYFTKDEITYFRGKGMRGESLAGIFAAKEAVVKALGTGFGEVTACDIEIKHDENGAPYVLLSGTAQKFVLQHKIFNINISISHCREYAVAYATAEVMA